MTDDRTYLTPDQFERFVNEVALQAAAAVARTVSDSVPRGSYTVPEIARRHHFSVDFVYRAIRTGKLAAVRPGAGSEMRVTPEAERLWLWGQIDQGDEPAFGVAPKIAMRYALKRALEARGN